MNLSMFKDRFIALIHDSDKTKPVIHKKNLTSSDIPPGYGCFFTVNGFNGPRKKENLTAINGVFADIDQKEGKVSLSEIFEMVAVDLMPSIINQTKNGWHLIWLLDESVEPTPENIQTVEGIHRRFVEHYGADNAAVDIGHLLRIPNTEHRKDPDDPFVITTDYEEKHRYSLEELADVYEPILKDDTPVEYGELGDDAQSRLDKMLEKSHIRRLWETEVRDDDERKSEDDLALLSHLAFYLAKDPNAIKTAFLDSARGKREKIHKHPTYLDMSIDTAIASTTDVYTPKKETLGVTDPFPQRDRYREHLAEGKWDNKDWVDALKKYARAYLVHFHKQFALVYPHLLFEKGRDKTFWNYTEEGTYEQLTQVSVLGMIIVELRKDGLDEYATDSQAKRILLNFMADGKRGVTFNDFVTPKDMIHVNNGWLNLETLTLEPHTPERLSLFKCAVDYDPEATCPQYDQFLDHDSQMPADQVRVIDQYSGVILTDDIRSQKMLIFEGRPGCGKSMLPEIWMEILGDKATSKKLASLSEGKVRFIGSSLANKTFLFFDEANPKTANINEFFMGLITDKKLEIERKGIDGSEYVRNTLKLVLSCNELPDHMPSGMGRRYRYIKFTRSFTDEGIVDPRFGKAIIQNELSGVLNRMIRGLKDYEKMGDFTVISGEEVRKAEYDLASDDISAWLSEHFEPVADDKVRYEYGQMRDAFAAEYPKKYNRELSTQAFNKKLRAVRLVEFSKLETGKSNSKRGYVGIKLKDGHEFDEYSTAQNPSKIKVKTIDNGW